MWLAAHAMTSEAWSQLRGLVKILGFSLRVSWKEMMILIPECGTEDGGGVLGAAGLDSKLLIS